MREFELSVGSRGHALAVCTWGPERGRPVVILHGFLEQGAAWDTVAAILASAEGGGRRVLAPDQRGHGRSGHVGAGGFYHFWNYVSDLDALVEHVGGPIDLVGHSMGGTVACLYAGSRPEQVRRLVLVEGLGPLDNSAKAVERGRQFLAHLREEPTHGPLASVDDAAQRLRRSGGMPAPIAHQLAERSTRPTPDGGRTWSWDPLHRARTPHPFYAAAFTEFLRAIEAPTLLVEGGASWFVVPDRDARVAAIRGCAVHALPGVGHMPHHEAPAALAALIGDHLGARSE